MNYLKYDIIIVGAGPAGCACAYQLRNENLKIALIDKAIFPRDKICGDAISADVVNQLYRIDKRLGKDFEDFTNKIDSHGVRFYAPNGRVLDIDFKNPFHGKAAGYISKRIDFDHFWFNQIIDQTNVDIYLNEKVTKISTNSSEALVTTGSTKYKTKMVIGADGAHSVVNKQLGSIKVEKDHYCAGIRQYYKGVVGFHPQNHIELHFYNNVLPGYFWIFPLPNNEANVGIGMLSSKVGNQKINLNEKMNEIITTHPKVKERFKNAVPLETKKGYGLPIGSKKRPISGNRFLLLGDAASLIDSFTGEGIANAIRSGRLAANHIIQADRNNCYDANFNIAYDNLVYKKMWSELRLSRVMQKISNYPKILNFVISKANKNESVRILLTSMLDNIELKKELVKPSFYFKLLFS